MPDPDLEFDAHGYLRDDQPWTPETAAALAERIGVGALAEQHLAVLQALRRHFAEHAAIPPPGLLCHELGLDADCIDDLFGGPANAWKIAGLPDPGEEARVYLENQTPGA